MPTYLIVAAVAYALGSIPFGYVLFHIFRGTDIRATGSGNIGATNVARSSAGLGIATLLLDAGKGYLAVKLALSLAETGPPADIEGRTAALAALAALFAIVGHVFPVWLRFRGGKGVATAVGAFLAMAPWAILSALALFAVLFVLFRYVSLSSMIAVASYPLIAWLFNREQYPAAAMVMMAVAALVIIARHHQNIRRLLAGTEPRFRLKRHTT